MYRAARLLVVMLFLSWSCWGCGGPKDLFEQIPDTINTVKASNDYRKQVAVVLTAAPPTAIGRTVGGIYIKTLADAIRDEDGRTLLVSPGDAEFPGFMAALATSASTSINTVDLAEAGRQAGYQGLVLAAVQDVRPEAKKTGIFWFRKMRFFFHYNLIVDLIDPYTASKTVSKVIEASVKVSEDDYEAYQSKEGSTIEDLNDAIADVAQDLGELIGQALKDEPWKAAVSRIQDGRLYIRVGRQAGVQTGDRLALFEGRRVLQGKQGQQFTAPGYKLAEVQVAAVTEQMVEAQVPNPEKVQVGDIVIPVK